jgi:hypothetical protein
LCYDLANLAKKLRFLLKLMLVFEKIVIITLVFEKNANFFAENWQKSQKTVDPWVYYLRDLNSIYFFYFFEAHTMTIRIKL